VKSLDAELAKLASKIEPLSKRSLVGLFWACANALLPDFQTWAAQRCEQTEPILREAMTAAYGFAVHGRPVSEAALLLAALEASTPAGDSPDETSSTSAQDCWICADIGVRVQVDQSYDAGPAIEYALEPVLSAASEELYGVSQIGASRGEEQQVRRLLQHSKVIAALEFCEWATEFLRDRPSPTEQDLALVSSRASKLAP